MNQQKLGVFPNTLEPVLSNLDFAIFNYLIYKLISKPLNIILLILRVIPYFQPHVKYKMS